MVITEEDNNDNANELMTLESFDCQNGHYKLTGQCENTPFHLLSSYSRAIIQYQFKSLTNFEIGVGGKRNSWWGHCLLPPPPLATALPITLNTLTKEKTNRQAFATYCNGPFTYMYITLKYSIFESIYIYSRAVQTAARKPKLAIWTNFLSSLMGLEN